MQDGSAKGVTARKVQVQRFYKVLWNAHDLDAIPSVLHDDFTFRGSLGDERRGHKGFTEYVDMVQTALGDFECGIEVLVEERDKVFATMGFGGLHSGLFMGYRPCGKDVVHCSGWILSEVAAGFQSGDPAGSVLGL